MLGIGNCKLYMVNKGYEPACFVIINRLIEVGAYPLAQVFCLAYIQQLILFIIIFVNTRLKRYRIRYLLKVFLSHNTFSTKLTEFNKTGMSANDRPINKNWERLPSTISYTFYTSIHISHLLLREICNVVE